MSDVHSFSTDESSTLKTEIKEVLTPGFYYHYKHSGESVDDYAYEVLNIAHHTEIKDFNDAALVIYRPLYRTAKVFTAGKHWDARPLAMFTETVAVSDKTIPRFRRITEPETINKLKEVRKDMYGM